MDAGLSRDESIADLTKCKQRLARAIHWQHLGARIERLQAVAPREPGGNGFTEPVRACRRRIHRQPVETLGDRASDEIRRPVLRLADRQTNRRSRRRHPGQQRTQFLEWIGLKLLQTRIHDGWPCSSYPTSPPRVSSGRREGPAALRRRPTQDRRRCDRQRAACRCGRPHGWRTGTSGCRVLDSALFLYMRRSARTNNRS